MAAKMTETSQEATAVSRREEFSDFALVLEDGRELKCHKNKLAEASPVFRMILKQDGEEARTNKMKMSEFEPATVESFLDYIYADWKHIPSINGFKKIFDDKRLTPELLRMAHMYEVALTRDSCIEHLLNNIKDSNVIAIWSAAETMEHDGLKKRALDYLGKKGKNMLEVPGFRETFQSPQMIESLVQFLVDVFTPATPMEKLISVKVVVEDWTRFWTQDFDKFIDLIDAAHRNAAISRSGNRDFIPDVHFTRPSSLTVLFIKENSHITITRK